MLSPVTSTSAAKRAAIVLTLLAMLAAGCGSSVGGSAARASVDLDPAPGSTSGTCATTVLSVLGDVATRVYNEGVASERTEVALRLIEHSMPLREAVERGDSQGARSAAAALLAPGHLTNLTVLRGKQTLLDVGAAHALAPLHGSTTFVQLSAAQVAVADGQHGHVVHVDRIQQRRERALHFPAPFAAAVEIGGQWIEHD